MNLDDPKITAAKERLEICKQDRFSGKGLVANFVASRLGFVAISNREIWAREELAELRHNALMALMQATLGDTCDMQHSQRDS